MLRAVLVGLLSISAVACKSSSDSPKVQPGVAAGKVVEVGGAVTVRRGDVARPLGKGDTVEGDDIVETGADGSVVIELAHNLARWELGASRKAKVRESSAWGLAKKSGDVATVEQDSAAAGRHAERSAAETSVSATESARAQDRAPAPAGAPPAEAPGAPPAEAPAPTAAPVPAPKPAPVTRRRDPAPTDQGDLKTGTGGGGSVESTGGLGTLGKGRGDSGGAGGGGGLEADLEAAPAPAVAKRAAHEVVLRNRKAIQACLTNESPTVSLRITIAVDGTAGVELTGKADVPDAVKTCVTSAVEKLKFAPAATTVAVDIAK